MKTSYQKTHKKLPTFCAGKPKKHDTKKLTKRRLAEIILKRSVSVSWHTHTDSPTSLVSLLVALSSLVKLGIDISSTSPFGTLVSVRICSVWKVQISY